MKTKYIIGIIGAVVLISAFIVSNANADKPVKYKLMGNNAPATLRVTGAATETYTIQTMTAQHSDTSGMYLDENGLPYRNIAAFYNVKYTSGVTEIYAEQMRVSYNSDDPTLNNQIIKDAIYQHAVDKWNWNIPAQKQGYNKITSGNQ